MLVIKQSATYLKDLKITRHFPRVHAVLQTQSLVPTCRKNQGFSASGICECILNKPNYQSMGQTQNIRLPMQRYRIHLTLSRRLCFLNVTKSKRFFLSVLQLNTIFSAHISSFKMIWKPSNSLPFEFSKDICIGSKNSAEAKIYESDFRPRFPLRIILLYI